MILGIIKENYEGKFMTYDLKSNISKELIGKRNVVYKIIFPDSKVYVGSTTQTIAKRLSQHRTIKCKTAVSKEIFFWRNMSEILGFKNPIKFQILHSHIPSKKLRKMEYDEINKLYDKTTFENVLNFKPKNYYNR